MRRAHLFCVLSVLALTLACGSSNGGIDISQLPPPTIVIGVPDVQPKPPTEPPPAPKPRATIAFQVVDDSSGQAIASAFVAFADGTVRQVNNDGYVAFERELGIFEVSFDADDYVSVKRRFQLEANRQFTVRLTSTKPPVVVPPPVVPPVVPPPVVPPVVVPPVVTPAPLCDRNGDGLTCVRAVAAKYPDLLQINTYESCVEFTQHVLAALGPDWGHVGKTAGEGQSVPRGFTPIVVQGFQITGVSHDAIKHRYTGQVVDLLGNASANSDPDPKIHGPASPIWSLIPPEHWRPNNPFVPAVPVR